MKGKLKVSNIDLTQKKITVVARTTQIDPSAVANKVTITTSVREPTITDNETEWIEFDNYVDLTLGIVRRFLGEDVDKGDFVLVQDSVSYELVPVDQYFTFYGAMSELSEIYANSLTVYGALSEYEEIQNSAMWVYGAMSENVEMYATYGINYGAMSDTGLT